MERLEWIRDFWDGPMVIKGILDPKMRAMQYVLVLMELWFLTTVPPAGRCALFCPCTACYCRCLKGDIAILADSGIRNGLDVVV